MGKDGIEVTSFALGCSGMSATYGPADETGGSL